MKFDLFRKNGEFRIECNDLKIYLSAQSLRKLLDEFQEDLEFIHKEYGQCSTGEILTMAMDALVMRDKIKALMEDEK